MLRSCLIVMRGSCLVPYAALRDDFGAVAWWSVEYWQVAWMCDARLDLAGKRRCNVTDYGWC
jgi:hypothetical protein